MDNSPFNTLCLTSSSLTLPSKTGICTSTQPSSSFSFTSSGFSACSSVSAGVGSGVVSAVGSGAFSVVGSAVGSGVGSAVGSGSFSAVGSGVVSVSAVNCSEAVSFVSFDAPQPAMLLTDKVTHSIAKIIFLFIVIISFLCLMLRTEVKTINKFLNPTMFLPRNVCKSLIYHIISFLKFLFARQTTCLYG